MKNILLISFALLLVSGCDSNVIAYDTPSVTCTADGCTASACASDCACGCEGAGGCACATNCTCVVDDSEDSEDDSDEDGSSTTNAVSIANGAFNPSTLTIAVGETVTWSLTNGTHTVVSDDGSWQSGSLSTGGTFTHQFDTAGEFGYKCGIHSSMTGTIIVQ